MKTFLTAWLCLCGLSVLGQVSMRTTNGVAYGTTDIRGGTLTNTTGSLNIGATNNINLFPQGAGKVVLKLVDNSSYMEIDSGIGQSQLGAGSVGGATAADGTFTISGNHVLLTDLSGNTVEFNLGVGTFINASGTATIDGGNVTASGSITVTNDGSSKVSLLNPDGLRTFVFDGADSASYASVDTASLTVANLASSVNSHASSSGGSITAVNLSGAGNSFASTFSGSLALGSLSGSSNCQLVANSGSVVCGGFPNTYGAQLQSTYGSFVGGSYESSTDAHATAYAGSFSGAKFDTSVGCTLNSQDGSFAVGSFDIATNCSISGSDGAFAGADFTYGSNCVLQAFKSLVSIEAEQGTDINITANNSMVVGGWTESAPSYTRDFNYEIALIAKDGTVNEITTNGFVGNISGGTNLSTSADTWAQIVANNDNEALTGIFTFDDSGIAYSIPQSAIGIAGFGGQISYPQLPSGVPTNRASIIVTNFTAGTTYSNSYSTVIQVSSDAAMTTAGVAGMVQLSLEVPGGRTNRASLLTAIGVVTGVTTNPVTAGNVPIAGTWKYRDTSSGAGDSAVPVNGQILLLP